MAKKIKRFFVFMFFSLFFSMMGGKKEVPATSKDGSSVSAAKSVLPLSIGGNTAEAGWHCY